MRKYVFALLLVSVVSGAFAQIRQTTTWAFDADKKEVKVGDEVELIFRVSVIKDWYIYSSDLDPDVGPIPTDITFDENDSFERIGSLEPVHPKTKHDEIWGADVTYFEGEGEFRQKIKVLSADLKLSGELDFQTCTDVNGQCIPGNKAFDIDFITVAQTEEVQETDPALPLTSPSLGVQKPATWTIDANPKTLKTGDEVELIFTVDIEENWHVYSSDFDEDLGPTPTEITFEPNDSFEVVGGLVPINPLSKYDKWFKAEIPYFEKTGEFRQKVRILKPSYEIYGTLDFLTCSDIDGKCIPGSKDFNIDFLKVSGSKMETVTAGGDDFNQLLVQEESRSLWGFFLAAFVFGLAALLTPCVFPMIPMTVAFFTNNSQSRGKAISKAVIYGVSIIAIYILIGLFFTSLFGVGIANELATGAIPNIIFFTVFVLFALSFFGMFEIVLPSGFVNRMDRRAEKGGLLGTFFMAFTLVLVSFSCTGPIVGTILIESFQGHIMKPVIGMLGFSAAFAIPFTLFAIFPGMLKELPKSGGWLNSVKVVLGFIELALGFKFLSVADQAYHWGLLDREIYIAIWLVIAVLLGMYLLGKLRLPHDDQVTHTSVPRLLMATACFVFAVYLLPGMFGAPLKALAGYLPPSTTHDFSLREIIREEVAAAKISSGKSSSDGFPTEIRHSNILHLPHGIKGFFDYDQALAYAQKVKKPLFIDFTGHGCVNCRKMEEYVWSDPKVLSKLKNDYVVVALYVDDKTELPEAEWYTSEFDGKVKKTIGKQNFDFQITRFNGNAQPYYVLLDNDEQPLVRPKSYDANVPNFVNFLDRGLKEFSLR